MFFYVILFSTKKLLRNPLFLHKNHKVIPFYYVKMQVVKVYLGYVSGLFIALGMALWKLGAISTDSKRAETLKMWSTIVFILGWIGIILVSLPKLWQQESKNEFLVIIGGILILVGAVITQLYLDNKNTDIPKYMLMLFMGGWLIYTIGLTLNQTMNTNILILTAIVSVMIGVLMIDYNFYYRNRNEMWKYGIIVFTIAWLYMAFSLNRRV